MELFSLIPTIGIALAWRRRCALNSASALLHAVALILMLLFLGSLAGLLSPTTLLIMVAGSLAAAVEFSRMVRRSESLPLPIVIFILLCVGYWLIHSGSSYYYYDEYSHWGVYLREMLWLDELWGADTNSMHPRYLPGTALWQYFFAVFARNVEGAAFLAQFALIVAPLMVLWQKASWQQGGWLLGALVLVVVSISNFGHGLTSLYVDHVLGVWFVGVLLNFVFEFRSRTALQLGSYVLPLAVIVLFKSTGFFFALGCAGLLTVLLFLHQDLDQRGTSTLRRIAKSVAFPSLVVLLCISIIAVWGLNRNAIGLESGVGETGSLVSRLVERESVFDKREQAELSRRFVDVVMHQQISKDEISAQYNAFSYPMMELFEDNFRLTTFSLLGLSLIAMLLVWHSVIPRKDQMVWAVAGGGTWLTAVVYVFVLFLGYRYIANNRNGFELSSYIRYAHSMLLPVVLIVFAPLLPAFSRSGQPRVALGTDLAVSRNSIIFGLSMTALIIFERPYLKPLYTVQQPPELRQQLEPLTSSVRELTGEAPIWVFLPNNVQNGFVGQLLQFQLTPGRAHVVEDATRLLADPLSYKDELRDYDYAWFVAQSAELDAAISQLTGGPISARLYHVSAADGDVLLSPVVEEPAESGMAASP